MIDGAAGLANSLDGGVALVCHERGRGCAGAASAPGVTLSKGFEKSGSHRWSSL
jgi:hypothetical protein